MPASALKSWRNFPEYPADYDGSCSSEDEWALDAWGASACGWRDPDRADGKLWMHWLDDPDDATGVRARKCGVDPTDPEADNLSFVHSNGDQTVRPWIDFFADWQAYQVAELVREAEFSVSGVTDSTSAVEEHVRHHVSRFDGAAREIAAPWEDRGVFLDHLSCYRTILAQVLELQGDLGDDVRRGLRSWVSQRGVDADEVRAGIRDVLLRLWQRWKSSAPVRSPRLMHRLQQDVQYATRLLAELAGEPTDPFDPFWCSKSMNRGLSADLIDALPYEEWVARREFSKTAVHYQRGFPAAFLLGTDQRSVIVARHWPTSAPLRRFCLAWVRLHEEMGKRDQGLPADMTIKASERIEQFNLIGLHTERLLRDVHSRFGGGHPGMRRLVSGAVDRAVRIAATPQQNVAGTRFTKLWDKTDLHAQRASEDLAIDVGEVATGSPAADAVVAAHLNAVIARNYAAHHDYLDDALIYPSRDEAKPHAGAKLLSSCLLVVIAAPPATAS